MATTEPCPKCGEQVSTATGRIIHHCQMIEVPPESLNSCAWEKDEDGIWSASCDKGNDNPFCFEDSGPAKNGFKFCPFCARPLAEVKPEH